MLLPREHGAYGQLGFPMLAAVAAGGGSAAAWLLVLGFIAAFVAHEPLLVLLGQRGPRARRELGRDATTALLGAGTLSLLAAAWGVLLMPVHARWSVLVPAAFALATVPMIFRQKQKTLAGEMHVALALASCALPSGIAAGLRAPEGAACWFVMTLGFWAATVAVRATIAVQRREPAAMLRAAAIAAAVASPLVAMLIAERFGVHPLLWTATLPLSLTAAVIAARPPNARHLRRVGWALVAGSGAAAALLVWLVRAS
jgi:hypothetical protein